MSAFMITLDSGATVSYIRLSEVQRLAITVYPNNQLALLADMKTRMASLGEVDFTVTLGNILLRVRALVMKNLQADCFGGTTFHADNDIEARIKTGEIKIHGKFVIKQSNPVPELPLHPPTTELTSSSSLLPALPSDPVNQTSSPSSSPISPTDFIPLSSPKFNAISLPFQSVILSGESLHIPLTPNLSTLNRISIVPSFPSISEDSSQWLPQICEIVQGSARYQNYSKEPIIAPKFAHFRPQPVTEYNLEDIAPETDRNRRSHPSLPTRLNAGTDHPALIPLDTQEAMSLIKINTSVMSKIQLSRLHNINKSCYSVFDNNLTGGYNHSSGQFYADFTFSGKPPPTRVFVPQYNRRCSDLQQAKCDELESQGVLVDPKLFGIPVLHVSPSWIQQKGRAKHKNLQDCTLGELRFITAFNTLNDSIRAKPSSSCSASSIFTFLSRWTHHIYADLNNSYFQLPVLKKLWSYLGVMTPHKGIRVMTRAGQGLLGSDVELEQLLCRVLGDAISSGYCVAVRDDIIIGGNSIDDALNNYEAVLKQLDRNNLKLSPNKVRIFPADTEIYGYRVKEGCIQPSQHMVDSLGKMRMESMVTVKSVNSWKGLYKRLIGHLPGLAGVMSPFDSATGGKNSREKFVWTPALTSAFNTAMSHLKQINRTYLPAPSEQLILLPDTMSVPPCTGWVLYTTRSQKLLPVVYASAKLKDYMTKWFPCEQEAVGVVLAIDQCAHWIGESELPTLVGPDSSAVVKATELIKRGKHSSNPRLQSLLASVNRRNIIFFHNSAKSGKHVVPDHLSRLRDTTCRSQDCAVERFLSDIPIKIESMATTLMNINSLTLLGMFLEDISPSPAIIAATSDELSEQLILRSGPIPLGSRHTWINIQKSDEECRMVFKMKNLGAAPRKKNTNPTVNKIFKEAAIHQGLLVVRAVDAKTLREVDRVVVPPTFLDSILTVTHVKLNHPSQFQLKQVFNRYFFSPKLDSALEKLYASCHLCFSYKKFPRELEQFSPSLFPSHPGSHMNIDILKRAGELILVNIDLFSGYVTTCFSNSEKSSDLSAAIIQVVTPIRHASSILVRVDKAPALVSLANAPQSELVDVGIKLEVGEDENKNSNCCVDKAISELEDELKKISPTGSKLTCAQLAMATVLLNNKIRNRGLSASEIHFSRDSHSNENLSIDDNQLREDSIKLREVNHGQSARSKAPKGKPHVQQDLQPGQVVYVRNHGTKHTSREPHIIQTKSSGEKSVIRKAIHSSPHDNKPISLSHQEKTVSNKFLFRPSPAVNNNQDTQTQKQNYFIPDIKVPDTSATTPPPTKWFPYSLDEDFPLLIETSSNDEDAEVADHPDLILFSSQSENDDTISEHTHSLFRHDDSQVEETSTSSQYNIHENYDEQENHEYSDEQDEVESLIDENVVQHVTPDDAVITHDVASPDLVGPDDAGNEVPINIDVRRAITYDDGIHVDRHEVLIQDRIPRKHDRISFYNQGIGRWSLVTITSNPNKKKGWKHFFHYANDDGEAGGIYLKPDERWTFIKDDEIGLLHNNALDNIPQVDGDFVPASLTPTPETSPDQEPARLTGTRPKQPIRFGVADFLSDSSDSDPTEAADKNHDPSRDSPEWDPYGTSLHSPTDLLDVAVNYGHSFPILPCPISSEEVLLDRAANLNVVLPLTSTPHSSPPRKKRISHLRRSLPLESPRNSQPLFLKRLNPFKKKKKP